MRYQTGQELIEKVDYEGGPYSGFIGHGISPEDVPEYLRRDVAALVEAGEHLQHRWSAILAYVEGVEDFRL